MDIATATRLPANFLLVMSFVRAGTEIAGVDETWVITVPSELEAARTLALYRDDTRGVTVSVEQGNGKWIGTGRAGGGSVNVGWEF
jgi:hypothetical protein